MGRGINRPVCDGYASRVLAQKIIPFPVLRRPDGSGHEAAATVGANIVQHMLHAGGTECTFIGADARVQRVGWQSVVAMLTGRSEFQHVDPFCLEWLVQKCTVTAEAYPLFRRACEVFGKGEEVRDCMRGARLGTAGGDCASEATAKPVLVEPVTDEVAGFEQVRLSRGLMQASVADQLPRAPAFLDPLPYLFTPS